MQGRRADAAAAYWIVLSALLAATALAGETAKVVDTMDDAAQWKVEAKQTWVAMTPDAEPHEGKGALRIEMKAEQMQGGPLRVFKPDASWNDFDGMSFWVKGDGSDEYGTVRIQAGNWEKAWVATFPLKDKAWHEVRIAWRDFVPAGSMVPDLGGADGYKPGDLNLILFGKNWTFNIQHKSPALAFSVDDIRVAKGIEAKRARVKIDKLPPVPSVVAKMKAGEKVTVLALGDSITWGTSAGGNAKAYPAVLGAMLRAHYKNDKIAIVSRAIGGSTTSKGRQWLDRDVAGLEADLTTVMFGYNEKAPEDKREPYTKAFRANLVNYVEEVAAATKAPPACLLVATIPGRDKNWDMLDCYAEAIRELGREFKNVLVADANRRFKDAGKEAYAKQMADEAHPNPDGQREMAKVLFEALTGEKPPADPAPPPAK